jgi:hypothetical protein
MNIMNASSGDQINVSNVTQTQINEIKNYFAESVAPVLLYRETNLTNKAECFYSSSQTQTLYDFKIILNNKEYLYSNKQLKGGTNTLKPVDVVDLIQKDVILKSKWSKTKTYKTFEILNKEKVISGPITVIKELYPTEVLPVTKNDMNKVISQMTQNDVFLMDVPNSIMKMIKSDASTYEHYKKKGYISGTMINFLFEKVLVEISKRDDSFNELFLDATNKNVHFFKFDLSSKGKLQFGVSDPSKGSKKAYLRSKQGVERRSSSGRLKLDKLGFQP